MNRYQYLEKHFEKAKASVWLFAFVLFLAGRSAAQPVKLDTEMRRVVIEGALQALKQNYVFPAIAQQMEQAVRQRMQRDEYNAITDAGEFARVLTAHLQAVSKDKHLRVVLSAGSRFSGDQRLQAVQRNYGFEKLERLNGNIGYLDLRGFEPGSAAEETATAAFNFLANTAALIVDLRKNGGGSPEMVAFLSNYLFDQRTHLNDIYDRPGDTTREFWTRENVPGKHYGHKPVFVLTSNYSFSGAEEFAYNLQALKRATLIGETTGGGAHPVRPERLGEHFIIAVPFARSINPITKTNWEGTGVKPDVAVTAELALKVAHLAALKSVQPTVSDAQSAEQLKGLIASLQQEVGAIDVPVRAAVEPTLTQNTATPSELKLPDTPVGKVLGKFVAAFNSGKLETMQQFHKELGGNTENAQQDWSFYQQSGGLLLHSVLQASATNITALAQTKKDGRWIKFSLGVEAQAPHGINELRIEPGEAPADSSSAKPASATPAAKPNEADALKQIGAFIEKQTAADEFSGVVLIAKNGASIFTRAVGLADQSKQSPNRPDTKFNLGSINKIFTHLAIMQLVEAGKLSLDDKLGKHLPAYPNQQAAEKVTLAHLINMQSGISDFFGPKFEATPKGKLRKINDYLPLFADQPLKFEPGTSRAYSNGGYVVLGAIIEKVTGQSYYDYVRTHIFQPAGMQNTESYESDAAVANLAQGYTRRGNASGVRVNNLDTRPARGSSAGGGYSPAEDLLKFTQAIAANKLLNAEHSRKFGGLGIAGGAPGINAALESNLSGGYTVIVLSNYDPPAAENLSEKIRHLLTAVTH